MKIYPFRNHLVRQLSLIPRALPLNNLRFIGKVFLASILVLWLLWMVDTLQQRDVLHLLSGGGRVLEEISVPSAEGRSKQPTHQSTSQSPNTKASAATHQLTPPGEAESTASDAVMRSGSEWTLSLPYWLMVLFRMPIIILFGIITPLAFYIWNWESPIYSETLNPYLMLLGAQAGSIIVGILLLGEGIVPFIGLLYSSLRVLQINGLLDLRFNASSRIPKPLRLVLRAVLLLWVLNTIALAFHILRVTWRLLLPG